MEKNDSLYIFLNQNHSNWIQKVISMRNGVEHPSSHSGKLIINDIRIINKERPPYFRAPTWHLEKEMASYVISDMEIIINNILELSEYLLIFLLNKLPSKIPLVFIEIPQDKRDVSCPIRFKVTLHPEQIGKFIIEQ